MRSGNERIVVRLTRTRFKKTTASTYFQHNNVASGTFVCYNFDMGMVSQLTDSVDKGAGPIDVNIRRYTLEGGTLAKRGLSQYSAKVVITVSGRPASQ